ncbi:MAG: DNA gyrase subunit A, partial [Deltaproteobacteria bacterium]|nr:DNA gyrase subunit A [Deltaproteobacteria bacterium]
MMDLFDQHITPVNIEDEMRDSYLEYAMSVIIGRALPDVRDGLKPVHRRVLFAMHDQGNHHNKPYRKSARVVGDVIGKYHPHGDSAVYDTVVRMAQQFSLRYPLVDGQGNFGSVDGDSAAAMRYTEVRMTPIAHEMLLDIDKDTVDFQPNYDESLNEPKVLPSRIPGLLLNGSTGIAVGMACNIPPHNLTEVCDSFLYYIDNRDTCAATDLMEMMPGPDFPTGGYIMGNAGILEAYATGRGIIQMRAKAEVETDPKTEREKIIVTEIPYMVNKARLVEKIADLVRDKTLEGISDLRDESDRDGMRIVIELKKGAMGEVLLNNLYKLTQMQTSFGIIMLAVVDNQPKVLSLPQVFHFFLGHRIEVVERRTRFELAKAQARQHILEGLEIALNHLDEVIEKIKKAPNPSEARAMLVQDYSLSEIQSKEILEMRLQRLTGLEQKKIRDELQEVTAQIADFMSILADRKRVLDIIRGETKAIREKYGDARRTEIIPLASEIRHEDLIAVEEMVVTISRLGYIKRTPVDTYRTQGRGGKGKVGMTTRDEDFVEKMFVASTHDALLIFTNVGKVYLKKVWEIPVVSRVGRGKAVVNLLPLEEGEKVRAYLPVSGFEDGKYILMATEKGIVKKTEMLAYANPRSVGIRAINIDPDDELTHAVIVEGEQEIFMATRRGLSLRINHNDIRPIGRIGRGVMGIRLNEGDRLVGLEVLESLDGDILTITENGYGKKTKIMDYKQGSRGNKGVFTIKTSTRNGQVVGILPLVGEVDVMLITQIGKLIRLNLEKLRTMGRLAQGVRLIQMGENEKVVAVATIV